MLHFVDYFFQPTQTFIKRYVEKSMEFAEVGIVSFGFKDIPSNLTNKVQLFEIKNSVYTRKNLIGATKYIIEKATGIKFWYSQLNAIINEFKPDAIHCHFGYMGVTAMKYGNRHKMNIPFVTSFYGFDISSLPQNDKEYLHDLKILWNKGSSFFAEGPMLAKKMTDLGCPKSKALINPLLIPLDEYPPKQQYRKVGDSIKFLFVGRFVEKKGFHLFLKAIGSIGNKLPNYTVTVVGDGSLKKDYEQILLENNLSDKISWLGMKTLGEIIEMMPQFDFLVHPSVTAKDGDSEGGAPTILIEAQAIGLPIITSTHADIPYVMGYHDFLAKENDIPSLCDTILQIAVEDNIEKIVQLGKPKVKMQHDLHESKIYETHLKSIIQ